jgi:hypothetical protein
MSRFFTKNSPKKTVPFPEEELTAFKILENIMRITAKISHYHKGLIAFLLAPFIWLQMYFFALEAWLFAFLKEELFNTQDNPKYTQLTHVLAFVCFSAFCLLAYYKTLDQYISLVLYSLWFINYLCVKFKTGLYVHKPAWIRLESKNDYWQWNLIAKNQHQQNQTLYPQQIKAVLIAAATYGDVSFRNQLLQIWHIYIQTKDEQQWVIYQASSMQQALEKAIALAAQLNTQVKITESYGTGNFPDIQIEAQNLLSPVWNKTHSGQTVMIYKNFSTVSLLRWLKDLFMQIKDFLFIAILAGFMSRYGLLLMLLFGDQFGLPLPEVIYIDLSLSGIAGVFAPDFNWITVFAFAATLIIMLKGIYNENRQHQIVIDNQRIQYSISGKKKGNLYFSQKPDVVVLKGFDQGALIFINSQNKVLEINGLADDEYDQLYALWLTIECGC